MPTQVSLTLPGVQSVSTGPRPAARPLASTAGDGAQAQQAVPQRQQAQPADRARVQEAVDTVNRMLQESSQQLRFAVDHDSGKMVVRVVDTGTNQTIRQIPSEVAIAISQSLDKLQGLLLRQQA